MGRERAYSINSLGVVLQARSASVLAGAAKVEGFLCLLVRVDGKGPGAINIQLRKSSPGGLSRRGCCRSRSEPSTIGLFECQLMSTREAKGGTGICLPLRVAVTSLGSIEKVEFWAETRSAESAETMMKERILKRLLLVVAVVGLVSSGG